ncbi:MULTISPECIES: hypothetical protein [unclassified Nocardia]|uniref:hypothetical protein n=1 Tax=Nocardia sp. NPDC060220 TaxID=3347076 RepID=UPI003667BF0C
MTGTTLPLPSGGITVIGRLRAYAYHYGTAVLPDLTIAACAVLVSAEAGHLTLTPTDSEGDSTP